MDGRQALKNDINHKIKIAQKDWEKRNKKNFDKERKDEFISTDGIVIKRIYTPLDLKEKNFDYLKDLSFPGDYPFTRGIDPVMYRKSIYKIGQYAGASSVEETNKLYKNLIKHGQESLHIAFDLPTKNGFDSDDPRIVGDVGRAGIAIDSLEDMEILFDGIDLSKYPCTQVITSSIGIILLAMLLAAIEQQGHSQDEIAGMMQNDVLTGYGAGGQYSFAPEIAMRLATDVCAYCVNYLPKMYALEICVNHWSQLGANRVQQIGIPLSNAISFIEASLKKDLSIEDIGPKLHMLSETNNVDFIAEIAKLRATRRLYAKIMKERFAAKKLESHTLKMHNIAPGGASLTRVPLEMNIARSAIATLAGALAGVQSVGGATYDEALGIPSAKASITSIQTRYLVAHECGVTETIDPLAGSYYVEYLTSELEKRASEFIKKVDKMGGAVEAIKNGFFQQDVAQNAYKIQCQIENKELIQLGTNLYNEEENIERRDYYKPNPDVINSQTAKLKTLKKRRDNKKVSKALSELEKIAQKKESKENNMMFPILDAVRAYATVGEISDVLRKVYGSYHLPASI